MNEKYVEERYPRYFKFGEHADGRVDVVSVAVDPLVTVSVEQAATLIADRGAVVDALVEMAIRFNEVAPDDFEALWYGGQGDEPVAADAAPAICPDKLKAAEDIAVKTGVRVFPSSAHAAQFLRERVAPATPFCLEAVLDEIEREMIAADGKYGPMPTILRGFHTIKCEAAELGAEVEGGERDTAAARKECVQLATMCFKLIRLIDGGATL